MGFSSCAQSSKRLSAIMKQLLKCASMITLINLQCVHSATEPAAAGSASADKDEEKRPYHAVIPPGQVSRYESNAEDLAGKIHGIDVDEEDGNLLKIVIPSPLFGGPDSKQTEYIAEHYKKGDSEQVDRMDGLLEGQKEGCGGLSTVGEYHNGCNAEWKLGRFGDGIPYHVKIVQSGFLKPVDETTKAQEPSDFIRKLTINAFSGTAEKFLGIPDLHWEFLLKCTSSSNDKYLVNLSFGPSSKHGMLRKYFQCDGELSIQATPLHDGRIIDDFRHHFFSTVTKKPVIPTKAFWDALKWREVGNMQMENFLNGFSDSQLQYSIMANTNLDPKVLNCQTACDRMANYLLHQRTKPKWGKGKRISNHICSWVGNLTVVGSLIRVWIPVTRSLPDYMTSKDPHLNDCPKLKPVSISEMSITQKKAQRLNKAASNVVHLDSEFSKSVHLDPDTDWDYFEFRIPEDL